MNVVVDATDLRVEASALVLTAESFDAWARRACGSPSVEMTEAATELGWRVHWACVGDDAETPRLLIGCYDFLGFFGRVVVHLTEQHQRDRALQVLRSARPDFSTPGVVALDQLWG